MSSQLSIFIPNIYTGYSEEDIKIVFSKNVGKVTRVDFTPARKRMQEGRPNYVRSTYVRSAYVYFAFFYNTRLTKNITSTVFHSNKGFHYTVSASEHWILLKNRNPVPAYSKTIHHVAHRLQLAEETIDRQSDIIAENTAHIAALKKMHIDLLNQVYRMQDVITTVLTNQQEPFSTEGDQEVYEKFNYMRFNKRYNKRWLLNRDDDGDTINQRKCNLDETSTIVSELDLESEYGYKYVEPDEPTLHYCSEDEDTSSDFDSSAFREYTKEQICPELFGRTVEAEMENYRRR